MTFWYRVVRVEGRTQQTHPLSASECQTWWMETHKTITDGQNPLLLEQVIYERLFFQLCTDWNFLIGWVLLLSSSCREQKIVIYWKRIPLLLALIWTSSCSLHGHIRGSPTSIDKIIINIRERKKVKSLSHVQLFATPWTVAYQAPPSTEFSRQKYWSGLPFPSPPSDWTQFSRIAGRNFTVCNVFDSSRNHPHFLSMEALSSTKSVPGAKKGWGPLWGLSKELLTFWCEIWRVTCGMSPLESKQYIQRKLNSYAWKVLLRLFIIDNVNGSHWFSGPALEMVWNK